MLNFWGYESETRTLFPWVVYLPRYNIFSIISSAVLNQCDSNDSVQAGLIMTRALPVTPVRMCESLHNSLARGLPGVLLVPDPQQTTLRLVSNLPTGGKNIRLMGLITRAYSQTIDHEINTLHLSMYDCSCNHIIFVQTSPTTKCLSDCLLHCLSHLTNLPAIKERV